MEILGPDAGVKKITGLTAQVKDANRLNVFVDGKYSFSLDIAQVVDLGLKVGQGVDDEKLAELKRESEFGKVYVRALEYVLVRPRSGREVRDYLYKKTIDRRGKDGVLKGGVSKAVTERVFDRLVEKGHIDDEKFARYYVENRFVKKGISEKRMKMELKKKGVEASVIEDVLSDVGRDDRVEIEKMVEKKRARYDDEKLVAYLVRQGFDYELVKEVVFGD